MLDPAVGYWSVVVPLANAKTTLVVVVPQLQRFESAPQHPAKPLTCSNRMKS